MSNSTPSNDLTTNHPPCPPWCDPRYCRMAYESEIHHSSTPEVWSPDGGGRLGLRLEDVYETAVSEAEQLNNLRVEISASANGTCLLPREARDLAARLNACASAADGLVDQTRRIGIDVTDALDKALGAHVDVESWCAVYRTPDGEEFLLWKSGQDRRLSARLLADGAHELARCQDVAS